MRKASYDSAPWVVNASRMRAAGALVLNHKSKKIPKPKPKSKKKKRG